MVIRMKFLSKLADFLLDLIFPPDLYCICCGNLIDSTRTYHLCDHCMEHFRWDGSDAKVIPIGGAGGSDGMLKMFSCTRYGIYERALIFAMKYNNQKYIARELGQIMADRIALADIDFDVIVPVPLAAKKERERGFNQAALMGKYMAKAAGKPWIADGLLRTEETAPMRGLGLEERKQNVKGKFAINEKYVKILEGRRILLIDDFYTTGSTAAECCRVLMETVKPEDMCFLAFASR